MSKPSGKCRKDSEIRPVLARSEYRSGRAGSPENRTALVTSSETSNSATSAVLSVIPRQESRNWRVYRRAQNGEVGRAPRASIPALMGRAWPGRAGSQADPFAGPATVRVSGLIGTNFSPCSRSG
jgi:hypothetical protein